MRNKILLAMAAAGMMCSASAFALESAPATPTAGPFGSGKVTFTGSITNSPCDIAPGDDDLTVKFGQISYRHLKSEHAIDTADAKSFTIHLQNCAFDTNTGDDKTTKPNLMSMVNVTFTGAASSDNKTFNNSGSATGVGLQLLDSAHTAITSGTATKDNQLQSGDNQLTFFAQLVNLGAENTVTPGSINVPVNYTLTYK
ncbi:fimbrial protein StdA [Salmonella enterica subsp. diarizonae serovar 16:z10:e,n,x,z15]|uniref:fimbrial protein n=1 Tax=Salmonella enterica TaxID=28901 RepID=UPI001F0F80B8|nr:fimbrial protein StdA [Salmonella enterica subsp. diarizonae serovar 16:z10:e,n,x,z15]MCH5506839.1 fimbrial protein StdA [Salmonella enterica subsp. diarizonae serovar 16:z10:e,n,x,z15]